MAAPLGTANGGACDRPGGAVKRADADPDSENLETYRRILAARNSIKIVVHQHGSVMLIEVS